MPSDVLQIVGQTIDTLARDLPPELKAMLRINQADALTAVSSGPGGPARSIVVSRLHALLKVCTLRTSPLPEEVRTNCLRTCLNGLWHWGKAHQNVEASQPLPPDFLDLAGLEITHHIWTEVDQASRVIGRCVGALVVNNLAACIKLHANSTALNNDNALAWFSAILRAQSRDVKLWLTQPGAIELVNMISFTFGDISSLATNTVPSYVLDAVAQTFNILSEALPAGFNNQLRLDQTQSLMDIPVGQCEFILPSCLLSENVHQGHHLSGEICSRTLRSGV